MSDRRPATGRMVVFHHPEDVADWPAMMLQARQSEGVTEVNLQVFRPRANFWCWAVEGSNPGQWSWPVIMQEPASNPQPTEEQQ